MDSLEKDLGKLLEDKGSFDVQKSEKLRKEMSQMFLHKFKLDMFKVKVVFWIFMLLSIAIMVGGYIGLRSAADTRGMLSGVLFFMIGFNSTILMKLWYWVVDTKLNVLKEIKQLQLQVAESSGKTSSAEN